MQNAYRTKPYTKNGQKSCVKNVNTLARNLIPYTQFVILKFIYSYLQSAKTLVFHADIETDGLFSEILETGRESLSKIIPHCDQSLSPIDHKNQ